MSTKFGGGWNQAEAFPIIPVAFTPTEPVSLHQNGKDTWIGSRKEVEDSQKEEQMG